MMIRPLVAADLPLIRAWMRDAPQTPAWSDDDLAGLITAPESEGRLLRRGWMTVSKGMACGFVVATALRVPGSATECEIEFVMTAPSCRRKGVARSLVGVVVEWARELTAEHIWLEVRASNHAAQRLYECCGFERVGQRPGYYAGPTEDAVLMRCRIDPGAQGVLV
jgi:ribosomal-protein-alanine N-acetyltransferase